MKATLINYEAKFEWLVAMRITHKNGLVELTSERGV